MSSSKTSLTYKDSGVDINAGNELIEAIKDDVKKSHIPGVLGGLGGFGGLFELPQGYKEPVLVSGTDGVGTKLRLAIDHDLNETVGQDLVAMCVNDLIVSGAKPLFFLDYYATGLLKVDVAKTVIKGIADGCKLAACALVGGETAEMPGMYSKDDYDLAGFCVGLVEKSKIIDGSKVRNGDLILGLKSSGPHSNGFSLIRKVIEVSGISPRDILIEGESLLDLVMAPTKIYVKSILAILDVDIEINAMAHITGGGLIENIARVLPANLQAIINLDTIDLPPVFKWLKKNGNIDDPELIKTFNCGIGMVLIINPNELSSVTEILNDNDEEPVILGKIVISNDDKSPIKFTGKL